MLRSLQSTHVWKWPVVKYKHIKIKPRICVPFILCLTSTVNANSLKQNIIVTYLLRTETVNDGSCVIRQNNVSLLSTNIKLL